MNRLVDNFVEYAIIAVLVIVVGIIAAAVGTRPTRPAETEFTRRAAAIEECLQSERFTRDECIAMFSGGVK